LFETKRGFCWERAPSQKPLLVFTQLSQFEIFEYIFEAYSNITRIKPSVDHLRIFGSPVYIHIPKEKRTKLEPSGKKGTFVRNSETSKAYRIYIPHQKFIAVRRDVTFHEEATFRQARELSCDSEE
jgi:hypothetical protein